MTLYFPVFAGKFEVRSFTPREWVEVRPHKDMYFVDGQHYSFSSTYTTREGVEMYIAKETGAWQHRCTSEILTEMLQNEGWECTEYDGKYGSVFSWHPTKR